MIVLLASRVKNVGIRLFTAARRMLRYVGMSLSRSLNESPSDADAYDPSAVAALSEKLHIPTDDVVEVYRHEFTRLHAQARVKTYVGVLALSNTKNILYKTTSRRC
jgi:hypothetical protein